jgi:hypothetical protein
MQNQKPQQKQTKHAGKPEQQHKHGGKMFRLDQRARIVDKRK